jgi:hypothetical protein
MSGGGFNGYVTDGRQPFRVGKRNSGSPCSKPSGINTQYYLSFQVVTIKPIVKNFRNGKYLFIIGKWVQYPDTGWQLAPERKFAIEPDDLACKIHLLIYWRK